jgi:hypothetical protein
VVLVLEACGALLVAMVRTTPSRVRAYMLQLAGSAKQR